MQEKRLLTGVAALALLAVSFMLMLNTAGAEEIAGYKTMPRLTPRPVTVTGLVEIQVSLNGTWRFNPAPPTQFWKTHLPSDTGWVDINVPGEWAMQGFKVEKDSAAGYWRNFSVPADWKQHRIKLHCDAVYSNALGTNDFRATRYSILWTSLKDAASYGVMVKSNGTQSTRCWLQADAIRLLVASFSTGGADPYFARHLAGERRPIDKGDILKDTVHLELINPLK